jgi:hypothetical protein
VQPTAKQRVAATAIHAVLKGGLDEILRATTSGNVSCAARWTVSQGRVG